MQEQAMIRKNKIEELNKKKMQEQAALDKFMNLLLEKDARETQKKQQTEPFRGLGFQICK